LLAQLNTGTLRKKLYRKAIRIDNALEAEKILGTIQITMRSNPSFGALRCNPFGAAKVS
jgi:hypothetical protein